MHLKTANALCSLDSQLGVTLKGEFETMEGKNWDVEWEAFKETHCGGHGSLFHTFTSLIITLSPS